jgi:hypothetical protein
MIPYQMKCKRRFLREIDPARKTKIEEEAQQARYALRDLDIALGVSFLADTLVIEQETGQRVDSAGHLTKIGKLLEP